MRLVESSIYFKGNCELRKNISLRIREDETVSKELRKFFSTFFCAPISYVIIVDESIVGVISQRLVKRLCSKCKEVDNEKTFKNHKLFKKCGCKLCKYTGYEGRQVVSSVCSFTSGFNKSSKEYDSLSNKSSKYRPHKTVHYP